jgi:NAD(P)-dependent dehydrogenase (short-subunit alcohol dehydrogenase family)
LGKARKDVLAGLSVAGLLVPEAVAYSTIAGLEPPHAIFAALAGLVVYALLGRSSYAITTPTSSSPPFWRQRSRRFRSRVPPSGKPSPALRRSSGRIAASGACRTPTARRRPTSSLRFFLFRPWTKPFQWQWTMLSRQPGDRSKDEANMRRALITGGARGIGYGVATAMLDAGYDVTVTGLAASEVAAVPGRSHLSARQLDVTDDTAVADLVGAFDRLDALVNCAGMIMRGAEFEIETFRKVVDVNLTGTMRMCLATRPKFAAAGGGAIVNTASMLSFFGGPMVPAYSASKGGVVQLTKSLAVAWAEENIRVNAIAPGWIATELTKGLVEDDARSAGILARTPMRRWGAPDDIGEAVAFLCSEGARFITGAVVPIDGGYAAV